jgi:hypothetical protein
MTSIGPFVCRFEKSFLPLDPVCTPSPFGSLRENPHLCTTEMRTAAVVFLQENIF